MCSILTGGLLLCTGALGYAGPLDAVAERRYEADWGGLMSDPAGYEVLVALRDCAYLGRDGWLLAGGQVYTVQVADCSQRAHAWPSPWYLGDVNRRGLNYQRGTLILRAER